MFCLPSPMSQMAAQQPFGPHWPPEIPKSFLGSNSGLKGLSGTTSPKGSSVTPGTPRDICISYVDVLFNLYDHINTNIARWKRQLDWRFDIYRNTETWITTLFALKRLCLKMPDQKSSDRSISGRQVSTPISRGTYLLCSLRTSRAIPDTDGWRPVVPLMSYHNTM